jgi:hypothetical protein
MDRAKNNSSGITLGNTMEQSNGISLQFQTVTLLISTIIIVLLVSNQIKQFCSADKPPRIFPLNPHTLQQFVVTPAKVDVGLTITDFIEFDVAHNKFQISGIIWFTFDPSLISLSTVEQFSFVRGQIDYKSEPFTSIEGGMLVARYEFRATFRTNLYYGFFPFEDHTLHLMLANMAVNPNEMSFQSSYANFIVDQPYVRGWSYADHKVTLGFGTIPLGFDHNAKELTHPAVLFTLKFFHHSVRYIISVLLPLLIIFFIDLFSLCFDQKTDHEILVALTTANITALVAYRFVLESLTPSVGYPTLADYFYFLFLSNTFIMFVINCVGPYLTLKQKKIISITIQFLVVSVIMYLLTRWISCPVANSVG